MSELHSEMYKGALIVVYIVYFLDSWEDLNVNDVESRYTWKSG